jgi:hypothetical protein
MEKAYDLKDLGLKLKAAGLPIAEEALEHAGAKVYQAFKQWAKESAVVSETKIDDVVAPFYDQLDPMVIPLIEKLDLDGDGK